jgi:hypothetical protein
MPTVPHRLITAFGAAVVLAGCGGDDRAAPLEGSPTPAQQPEPSASPQTTPSTPPPVVASSVRVERVVAAFKPGAAAGDNGQIIVVARTTGRLPTRAEGQHADWWVRGPSEPASTSGRERSTVRGNTCTVSIWWQDEQDPSLSPPLMPVRAGTRLLVGYGSSAGTLARTTVTVRQLPARGTSKQELHLHRRAGCISPAEAYPPATE